MNVTQDPAIKVTENNKTLLLFQPIFNAQLSHQDEDQPSTKINQTQLTSEPKPSVNLQCLFGKMALVGQMGSVIILIFLALEIVSGLTVAMLILGISWIGCEHFCQEDAGDEE